MDIISTLPPLAFIINSTLDFVTILISAQEHLQNLLIHIPCVWAIFISLCWNHPRGNLYTITMFLFCSEWTGICQSILLQYSDHHLEICPCFQTLPPALHSSLFWLPPQPATLRLPCKTLYSQSTCCDSLVSINPLTWVVFKNACPSPVAAFTLQASLIIRLAWEKSCLWLDPMAHFVCRRYCSPSCFTWALVFPCTWFALQYPMLDLLPQLSP